MCVCGGGGGVCACLRGLTGIINCTIIKEPYSGQEITMRFGMKKVWCARHTDGLKLLSLNR